MINASLLLGLFASLALGNLGRISFFGQSINGYIFEFFVLSLFISLFIQYRFEVFLWSRRQFQAVYIFLGILAISLVVSIVRFRTFENVVAFLYLARLTLYFSVFLHLAYHKQSHKPYLKVFKKVFLAFAVLTAIFTIVQYTLYPNLRNLFYLGWDEHLYRAFGLFFDTSVAAAIYGLTFLALLMDTKHRIVNAKIRTILMALNAVFLILSFARGGYIALIVTAAIYMFRHRMTKLLIAGIVICACIFILAPKPGGEGVKIFRTNSIQSRIKDDTAGIELFRRNPILGVGYNHLRGIKPEVLRGTDLDSQSHAAGSYHSSFVTILATGGILGFVALIYMLISLARISESSLYFVVFLSIFSLFDNILLHPFVLILALFLIAYEYEGDITTSGT